MYSIGATIQLTIVMKEKTVKLSELHRILLNFSSPPSSLSHPHKKSSSFLWSFVKIEIQFSLPHDSVYSQRLHFELLYFVVIPN